MCTCPAAALQPSGRLLPRSEGAEELLLRIVWDRLLFERTDHLDGPPHLIEVITTTRTYGEVILEAHALLCRQCPLEILGDKLDELLAA
jgi:hypothetical protein